MSRDSIQIELQHIFSELDMDESHVEFLNERLQKILNDRIIKVTSTARPDMISRQSLVIDDQLIQAMMGQICASLAKNGCYKLEEHEDKSVTMTIQVSRFA